MSSPTTYEKRTVRESKLGWLRKRYLEVIDWQCCRINK
ncbi:predicted protein [Sclerotinia sclerotiorum 1980 UF-70]|uniref:Uncharacterized protein n=1 Tax=Sclerotinia sclerotiorum (strain ATCC 18683 / 1980 / Ss-1) TaxID=665079 RepID=A7F1U9_SCLS1|nr:predicted protein [Sclerotinia sclerotiorum 1980 UF-70]EDN95691.1 predicted protein [Sclerotinia sclerotiorum 1980 UF-70]